MPPVRILLVGAGSRGAVYANYVAAHAGVELVGLAEPRADRRVAVARRHATLADASCEDWRLLAARSRFADAVIIATGDADHVEPAVAFAGLGYHVLLEKPMAPTADGCRRVVAAARQSGVIFAVCHVLRYTRYTERVKALVTSGRIGRVVSLSHLEPVGYWHQAHSYVRGSWRNQAESSSMLLAKSCHDLDWIRYIVGERCRKISSFGNLLHFRADDRPAGAAERCVDCGIEPSCPYSAKKIYLGRARLGQRHWPVDVLTTDLSEAGLLRALTEGPYGRCVYACDNDVVDHQVVNMQFESGATASFTMTGFTRQRDRETHIFGTRGELFGDGNRIRIHDFLTDETETLAIHEASDGTMASGHGGGDDRLMDSFVAAVAAGDASKILTGFDDTLESHLMVFAAEAARLGSCVVDIDP